MNSTVPTVSVVIPTYGHRAWVLSTLESVFAQTYRDFEVIVVNDGSPDDTAALLAPLAAAGRIRYIEQPNRGQSAARNTGLDQVRGEFVALLDDDDLWPPDKLAWQVDCLRSDPSIGVVAGPAEVIDEHDRPVRRTAFIAELSFRSIFRNCPISSPGQTLIRRALLERVGRLDSSVAGVDDWDLWFKLARVSRFVMEDRVALRYRRHGGNASHQVVGMYESARVVARRHSDALDDRRDGRAARRDAFEGLHTDTGWASAIGAQLRTEVRAGRWRAARRSFQALGSMWAEIGGVRLPALIARDLLPPRIAGKVSRIFRRKKSPAGR